MAEICERCGLPKWTYGGSKQESGTCMAHLDQTEPEEIIACRDRELAKLRPTRERFYHWWSGLSNEERVSCWYDLDAMAHGEVVSALSTKLAAATARAEAAEAKVRDVETLVNHVKAIHGHEREFTIGSCALVIHDEGLGDLLVVTGAPEFCIIKAAQWVRENSPPQKKPTDEGGRGGNAGGATK